VSGGNGHCGDLAGGRRNLTGGAHMSVEEGERLGTHSGSASWAAGCFSFWAETFPGVHFIFLFCFIS
jgi:hypothetical protein